MKIKHLLMMVSMLTSSMSFAKSNEPQLEKAAGYEICVALWIPEAEDFMKVCYYGGMSTQAANACVSKCVGVYDPISCVETCERNGTIEISSISSGTHIPVITE